MKIVSLLATFVMLASAGTALAASDAPGTALEGSCRVLSTTTWSETANQTFSIPQKDIFSGTESSHDLSFKLASGATYNVHVELMKINQGIEAGLTVSSNSISDFNVGTGGMLMPGDTSSVALTVLIDKGASVLSCQGNLR